MANETTGREDNNLPADEAIPEPDGLPNRPPALNLDVESEDTPRIPVVLGGTTYWMQHRYDLSFAESDELSRILLEVSTVRANPAAGKGDAKRLSKAQEGILDALEIEICRIALGDPPAEALALLKGPANDEKRSRLIKAFLSQPDIVTIMRTPVQNVTPSPSGNGSPAPLRPLRPAGASKSGRKRASSTAIGAG